MTRTKTTQAVLDLVFLTYFRACYWADFSPCRSAYAFAEPVSSEGVLL